MLHHAMRADGICACQSICTLGLAGTVPDNLIKNGLPEIRRLSGTFYGFIPLT